MPVMNEEAREAGPSEAQQSGPGQIHKVFVVLNPVAGLTDADNSKQQITEFCSAHQWECDIHETQKNEDVTQLVKDALKKGVDVVIAAGGDGTVSSVVAGMVNSKVPMGILPSGTGNNLARDLSIPLDITGALKLLDGENAIRIMDVMEVNQKKYYVLNVSVGISSMTMHTTRRKEKRRFGMLAYIYRAIASLKNASMHRFVMDVDNRKVEVGASELMIANSKLMGMQPKLDGVEVDPNDGCMDLFIVRAQSFRDYLDVASGFLLRKRRFGDPNLHYLSAKEKIHIRSDFPLPVQADGEVVGNTPVEIRLMPSALQVITPKSAATARKES